MIRQIRRQWAEREALRKQKSGKLEEAVAAYVGLNCGKRAPASVSETRFVVFDVESTGLSVRHDRIISIGAVALQGGGVRLDDAFEAFVRQDHSGGHESAAIHGILTREIAEADEEPRVLTEFLDYVGDSVLVAHHAWFDTGIVGHALKKHFGVGLFNQVLDTLPLAHRLEHGPNASAPLQGEAYSLDALCERYGVPFADRHNAAADAYATALLLLKLLRLSSKKGITKLSDLLKVRSVKM